MSNKYNKLYFMHIPKTGGRYIIYNVIDPIRQQLKQNNIKILEYTSGKSSSLGHQNWHSEIDDQTYIITCLRDPVSQLISLYTHIKTTDHRGFLKTNTDVILSKNNFYKTINNYSNYQNFQAKNFIRKQSDGFALEGSPTVYIDEGLLEKRLNRVNLLLNNNNLHIDSIEIQKRIFLDLGISGVPVNSKFNGLLYNPHSKDFFNQFSNAEKDSISVYSKIDTNLYRNANYHKI